MSTWSGEVKCPKCGHWQIPMNYCPSCGHAFGGVYTATYSLTLGWVCGKCKSHNLDGDSLCGFCDTPRLSG